MNKIILVTVFGRSEIFPGHYWKGLDPRCYYQTVDSPQILIRNMALEHGEIILGRAYKITIEEVNPSD